MEECQRMAFAIFLQNDFKSYFSAVQTLGQKTLSDQHQEAAIRFGEKCLANPRHADMFIRNMSAREDVQRRNWKLLKEFFVALKDFLRVQYKKYLAF